MSWIAAAVASAVIMGMVNVVDSHLLKKRVPTLRAYLIVLSVIHLTFSLVLIALYPLPCGVPSFSWLIAALSALSRTAAVLLMLYVMRSQEISRIVPVVYIYPVFVAVMAVPLLGEVLTFLQWLAIVITVAGAVLISVRFNGQGRGAWLGKSFVLLAASCVLFGMADTAAKYALDSVSFWNMYSINALSYAAVFALVSARPSVLREIYSMRGRNAVLRIIGVNEVLTLGGIVLSFWAMERGPVSLVSTIGTTRAFFVFLYAIALSRYFPSVLREHLSRSTATIKLVSIVLVVSGVVIINLAAGAD